MVARQAPLTDGDKMKIVMTMILLLLVLLSISSGINKIMLMPQEVEFFGGAGMSNMVIIAFGAVQVMGGSLLIAPKSRLWGVFVMVVTFTISTVLILIGGSIGFGLFSILPIILLGLIARDHLAESPV